MCENIEYDERTVEFGSTIPTVKELAEVMAAIDLFREAEESGVIIREAETDSMTIERRDAASPDFPMQWGVRKKYESTASND